MKFKNNLTVKISAKSDQRFPRYSDFFQNLTKIWPQLWDPLTNPKNFYNVQSAILRGVCVKISALQDQNCGRSLESYDFFGSYFIYIQIQICAISMLDQELSKILKIQYCLCVTGTGPPGPFPAATLCALLQLSLEAMHQQNLFSICRS